MDSEDISSLTDNYEHLNKEKLYLAEINNKLDLIYEKEEMRKSGHKFILLGIPALAILLTFFVAPFLTVEQMTYQISFVVTIMASAEVINYSFNGSKSKNKKKIKYLNNRKMSTELVIDTISKELENEKKTIFDDVDKNKEIIPVSENIELDINKSLKLTNNN